jgi:AcrR family transcriptional regulator
MSSRARGPYAKSAEQRRRILDVAQDVFGRRGSHGASLREIADLAGMSQAGVLHHFGSKTGLLMAVLEERDQASRQQADTGATWDEQAQVARNMFERAIADRGLTQLFTTVTAESIVPGHPAHDFTVARYRRTAAEFTAALTEAAPDELEPDAAPATDLAGVARLVMAAMDGLQLQALLEPDADVLGAFDILLEALPLLASRSPASTD